MATTHGESRKGSKEYKAWAGMLSRCRDPNNTAYHNYGGRGIEVCVRWESFERFLEDMGRKPSPLYSLDRIDVDGDYEPDNCRWASKKEQDTNRRQTRRMEMDGEIMCLKDWARKFKIHPDTLAHRLSLGWTLKRALTVPVKKYRRAGK